MAIELGPQVGESLTCVLRDGDHLTLERTYVVRQVMTVAAYLPLGAKASHPDATHVVCVSSDYGRETPFYYPTTLARPGPQPQTLARKDFMDNVKINPAVLIDSLREENRILFQEQADRKARIVELETLYEGSYAEANRVTRLLTAERIARKDEVGALSQLLDLTQGEVQLLRGNPRKMQAAQPERPGLLKRAFGKVGQTFSMLLGVVMLVLGGVAYLPLTGIRLAWGNKLATLATCAVLACCGLEGWDRLVQPYMAAHHAEGQIIFGVEEPAVTPQIWHLQGQPKIQESAKVKPRRVG